MEPQSSVLSPQSSVLATLADSDDMAADGGDEDLQIERALLYSTRERLLKVDFARMTEEEMADAKRLLANWRWDPGVRRTRRLAAARRGRSLDFGRTVRR